MEITRENKKEKAIEIMKKLDIYKPYIKGFRENDKVCFFENFGGFWVYQEPETEKKMREIEEKYDCLVKGRSWLHQVFRRVLLRRDRKGQIRTVKNLNMTGSKS